MQEETLRSEVHKFIDHLDESKLKVLYSLLLDQKNIIGSRPNGTPITLADLRKGIERSDKDLAHGNFLTVEESKRKALNW